MNVALRTNKDVNSNLSLNRSPLSMNRRILLKCPDSKLFTCSLLIGAKPVNIPNYRLSEEQTKFLKEICVQLEKEGHITRTRSAWNSPVQLVPKKGSWRFTVNYKDTVNKNIQNDSYPSPLSLPLVQHMSQYKVFDQLDLSNGYWNVKTNDKSTQELLAFSVPGVGQYTWLSLPQGLKTAPSLFQRFMDDVFGDLDFVRVYMDDITIGAMTLEELIPRRKVVLDRLDSLSLKLNPDKSVWGASSIKLLGMQLSHGSVKPTDDYVNGLLSWPDPNCAKDIRKFMGKLAHITASYPGLQKPKSVLYKLLNKGVRFSWGHAQAEAFKSIKLALAKPTELTFISSAPITLVCDAGEEGFSANFLQEDKSIHTLSRKWKLKSTAILSSSYRELLGITEALRAQEARILNFPITVICDNEKVPNIVKKNGNGDAMFTRLCAKISHFNLNWKWERRTSERIKKVDAMGRFSDLSVNTRLKSFESTIGTGVYIPIVDYRENDDHIMPALVDTGADASFITESSAKIHCPKSKLKRTLNKIQGSHEFLALGTIEVPVFDGISTTSLTLYVVPDTSQVWPVLLGHDYITKTQLNLTMSLKILSHSFKHIYFKTRYDDIQNLCMHIQERTKILFEPETLEDRGWDRAFSNMPKMHSSTQPPAGYSSPFSSQSSSPPSVTRRYEPPSPSAKSASPISFKTLSSITKKSPESSRRSSPPPIDDIDLNQDDPTIVFTHTFMDKEHSTKVPLISSPKWSLAY